MQDLKWLSLFLGWAQRQHNDFYVAIYSMRCNGGGIRVNFMSKDVNYERLQHSEQLNLKFCVIDTKFEFHI